MIKCITTGLNVCGPDLDLRSLALREVNKIFYKTYNYIFVVIYFPRFYVTKK